MSIASPTLDHELQELLHGDQGNYAYLFPNRERVPTITEHPFAQVTRATKVEELVIRTMLDIDYIGWTAKAVLGLNLFPMQLAVLQTMWHKPFPMLVASRGAGKCVRGDTLCRTSDGLLRIDEIVSPAAPVLEPVPVSCEMQGENGFNRTAYGWNNGISATKKITLRSGVQLEATLNHPIRCIAASGHLVWKYASGVVPGDIVPIDRSQYAFGTDSTTSEDLGWWLGAMVGDGTWTQRSVLIFSCWDDDIATKFIEVSKNEFGYAPRHTCTGQYRIHSTAHWDRLNGLYGLGGKDSYTKVVPQLIRKSPRGVVAAFLRGLFDTDGSVSHDRPYIEYTSCSESLARGVQQLLLGFGIVSTLRSRTTKSQRGTAVKSWRLTLTGVNNLSLYAEHIGFVCRRKHERLRTQSRNQATLTSTSFTGLSPSCFSCARSLTRSAPHGEARVPVFQVANSYAGLG